MGALSVWFKAGSRTRPHVHPVDQVLHMIEGEGIVARETEKRIIRAREWVVVPAGIWHWHGSRLVDVSRVDQAAGSY